MNCSRVVRWLDQGMPAAGREAALRHVEVCEGCAEAYGAARRIDVALRSDAAREPALDSVAGTAFVKSVMARVAAAEPLAREGRFGRTRALWWLRLATDPLSAISVTAALVVAVWTAWHPKWFLGAGGRLMARWWSPIAALAPSSAIDV